MNMSGTPKRIWTTFDNGGEYAGAQRELYKLTRNEYGDFLFTLDGGEVWQFTPQGKLETPPTVENVAQVGIGQDSKTGKPCHIIAFLVLKNKQSCTGNIRILPRETTAGGQAEPKPTPSPNPEGRKVEYSLKDDARILALYRGQPERISIETFREENQAIKKDYTLRELRRLIDRAGKRERKAVAMKQREAKLKKRQ